MRSSAVVWMAWLLIAPGAAAQSEQEPVAPPTTATAPQAEPESAEPSIEEGRAEFPVGPQDLLEIRVFEFPELNLQVRVSEEGSVFLPLVGEISVAGLMLDEVEERLEARLAERHLKDPQVSVFVKEHGSKNVSVLGMVRRPGMYQVLGARTLLEVLSQAGGLREGAGEELYVIRNEDGEDQRQLAVDIENLLAHRDPSLNLEILPGDIVSVPADPPLHIYVDGAVRSPGRLDERASRPITLMQAIAKAGGPTDRANLKAIQILRQQEDGTQLVLRANLKRIRKGKEANPTLEDGDVIVVPESFF